MKTQFVSQEIALELKQLGFDKPCCGYYDGAGYVMIKEMVHCVISAPTFSQAFRFFREKCDLTYSIDWMTRNEEHYSGYIVHFRGIEGNKINEDNFIVLNNELPSKGYEVYKTYEEAELACLVKLIEIVKEKK